VLVGIAMILMGAGSALAGFQRTLFTHIVLMDLVLCAGLLRLEGQAHAVYAFAFLALGGLVLANARRQEQLILAAVLIRLRLEAQQAATQRARDDAEAARRTAERANASKTTFLAAAGHDLRQPMHALVQYFAQIRRKNADAALQTTIAAAGQAVDALGDLLDAVLEVSKLMMGSVQPVVTRVDLPLLFDRLAAQLRPLAESKGLALVLQAPAGAAASSDAVLLERVLRNLCVNAVNFTATGTVTLRAALRPSHVLIQVLDTGCGIAPAHQAQVFEPLFQVGNAARDRQKGLGLGLSIVKDLCALLDIRLRLRSTPGRGTLFSLHLPLPEAAPAPQAAEVEAAPRHLRGSLVLLIDDNSASLEATATTLRDAGCSVLTATSAAQALQALAGQDELPHAVLSDYRLADGLTGLDAIATVREHLAQRFGAELAVPALLISGDTAPAELARVQASGLSLLHKPLAPERLLAALNRLLASLSTTA
jgi:signal transduction histidine kinase/ActR/RegA family two-component response regulator